MNAPRGLSSEEARERLARSGPNALPEKAPPSAVLRFVRQFKSPLIYVLFAALLFDIGHWIADGMEGAPIEGVFILSILVLNAGLGAFQEHRSEHAIRRLKLLAAQRSWVMRDGAFTRIAARDIVPDDVVRLGAGERVPADGTLVDGDGLLVDESMLTGESLPVDRTKGDEVKSGSLVVRGHASMRVQRTGAASAMGQLAASLEQVEVDRTPLEKRIDALGRRVAYAVGGIAVVLAALGLVAEGLSHFSDVLLLAVALAVAAVPEGMPAVVTLALALGLGRMAKKNAVVRRLSSVESLGSVTVIVTDKTGTLTENRMHVAALDATDEPEALRALVLANDADTAGSAGDPLDLGLLSYARERDIDVARWRSETPRVSARPFESAWKFSRATVTTPDGPVSYFKGAPEAVLPRCTLDSSERERFARRANEEADRGRRVLALARIAGEAEEGLAFLGFVSLDDPPRAEVPASIDRARRAGVRVLMATGDHPGTARAIAAEVGLDGSSAITGAEIDAMSDQSLLAKLRSVSVFARVSPAHKLRIVETLKADGQVVAMTGDGVNDAPALKRSDVGVAMGIRGSDVAREVADIVLMDDDFSNIVRAIEEGRRIYQNLQAFLRYTFLTNVSLVFLMIAGALGSYVQELRAEGGLLLLPLTAIQLLWINFVGDGPPALAFALDRPSGVMDRPPRDPRGTLLGEGSTSFVVVTGLFKGTTSVALLVLLPALGYGWLVTRTAIFLYESIGKLASAYASRRVGARPRVNVYLHAAVALGVVAQVAAVEVPALRSLLLLAPMDAKAYGVVALAVLATWAVGHVASVWLTRPRSQKEAREPGAWTVRPEIAEGTPE